MDCDGEVLNSNPKVPGGCGMGSTRPMPVVAFPLLANCSAGPLRAQAPPAKARNGATPIRISEQPKEALNLLLSPQTTWANRMSFSTGLFKHPLC